MTLVSVEIAGDRETNRVTATAVKIRRNSGGNICRIIQMLFIAWFRENKCI